MHIVELNGGLGNQILQYVFGRFLEIYLGYEVFYDTAMFDYIFRHNGYELSRVFPNSKIKLLKDQFDANIWDDVVHMCANSIVKVKVPDILLESEMDIAVVADEYWHTFGHNYEFAGPLYRVISRDMLNLDYEVYEKIKKHQSAYFKGVWFNGKFGEAIKQELISELEFPEFVCEQNIKYREDILSKETSVGIHVRRGDFLIIDKTASPQNFAKKIKELRYSLIKSQKDKAAFYIFSDDIAWCKENVEKLGLKDQDYVVFIEGNDVDGRNYMDMQLMGYCDYLIHNIESSFCVGASLASKKDIRRIRVK